ncbi:yeats family-domain-containing protein [Phycomyces nitens]|nr:yeats family-domain-containing protein [Phycomyces nitens]
MTEASQDIRITCQNSIIKGASATSVDGHPWRTWKIKLVAMDGNKEKKGKLTALLDNVEYILHPTFENPHRVTTKEPYVLQEKGWGEFDMRIVLNFAHKLADPETILFDLNFTQPSYTVHHKVVFPNPSPELEALLALDVPADVSSNGSIHSKKRRSSTSSNSGKGLVKKQKTTYSPAFIKHEDHTSASPSTPSFYSNKTVQYPPLSSYSGSPPSPSFDSPALPISPAYDYGQVKTPQAYSEHDSVPYLSGMSDESQRKSGSSGSSVKRGYESEDYDFPEYQHPFRPYESSDGEVERDDAIVDDVYDENDLKNVNPIHSMPLDAETRRAWGIPEVRALF